MFQASLRQRIRNGKIKCKPWKRYRGEIRLLPVSSQCLFANKGMELDVLEVELKDEGWLEGDEGLWDVLSDITRLMFPHLSEIESNEREPFDDSWTEEDYINFYKNL